MTIKDNLLRGFGLMPRPAGPVPQLGRFRPAALKAPGPPPADEALPDINPLATGTALLYAVGSSEALARSILALIDAEADTPALWKKRATALLPGLVEALVDLRDGRLLTLDRGAVLRFLHPTNLKDLADPRRNPNVSPAARDRIQAYVRSIPAVTAARRKPHDRLVEHVTAALDALEEIPAHRRTLLAAIPWRTGHAGTVTQMLASLMGEGYVEDGHWRGRALSLLRALVGCLACLRDAGRLELGIASIREYMTLERCIELPEPNRFPEVSETARARMVTFLASLAGYDNAIAATAAKDPAATRMHPKSTTAQFDILRRMLDEQFRVMSGEPLTIRFG